MENFLHFSSKISSGQYQKHIIGRLNKRAVKNNEILENLCDVCEISFQSKCFECLPAANAGFVSSPGVTAPV